MKSPKDRMIFSGVCLHLYFALFFYWFFYNTWMIWTLVHFGIMLHRMLSLIFFVSHFPGPFWHRIWLLLTRFRLLFSFFFAGYESWNKSSWKEKYFFTSIGLFFRRNFLDVEKGIKWYEIKLDRGSLLQVRRVLFLVEIAHDVTVLQWTN